MGKGENSIDAETFWAWVEKEINLRDLSYYKIEQIAGLSNAAISKPARYRSEPTLTACQAIARAFKLPLQVVLVKAGILPDSEPGTIGESIALDILRALPAERRECALDMLRGLDLRAYSPQVPRSKLASIKDDDDLTNILIESWPVIPQDTKLKIVELLRQAMREQSNTEKQRP